MDGNYYLTAREKIVLSPAEQRVLRTFRRFLMTPGKMLCFYGPNHKKHKAALEQLMAKGMVVAEKPIDWKS